MCEYDLPSLSPNTTRGFLKGSAGINAALKWMKMFPSTQTPGADIGSFISETEIEIETLINSEMTFKCVIGRGVGYRNSTDLDDCVDDDGGVSQGDIITGVLCDGWIHHNKK